MTPAATDERLHSISSCLTLHAPKRTKARFGRPFGFNKLDGAGDQIAPRPPEEEFYAHRPSLWRRLLRWPKYFRLDYVVVIGDKKFLVSTMY
jgi:hypothetical protein